MSIEIKIIEKRLNALENSIEFLSQNLATVFPHMGVDFDSVCSGLSQTREEIEGYKASKVRAKRNDFFERNEVISHQDLAFLIRQYAPVLAASDRCDRVTHTEKGRLLGGDAYELDLSNLDLQSVTNGISAHNVISHQLKIKATVEYGVGILVRETATVDMETITYTTTYDVETIPLAKDRIIAWFYDQLQLVDPTAWKLPEVKKPDTTQWVVSGRKLSRVDGLIESLQSVATDLVRLAHENDTRMYGITLWKKDNVKRSMVLHTYVGIDDVTGEISMVLRIMGDHVPFNPGYDLNFEFPYHNPQSAERYNDFETEVDKLSLKKLGTTYEALQLLSAPDDDRPLDQLNVSGERLTIEWSVGEKRTTT